MLPLTRGSMKLSIWSVEASSKADRNEHETRSIWVNAPESTNWAITLRKSSWEAKLAMVPSRLFPSRNHRFRPYLYWVFKYFKALTPKQWNTLPAFRVRQNISKTVVYSSNLIATSCAESSTYSSGEIRFELGLTVFALGAPNPVPSANNWSDGIPDTDRGKPS